MPRDLPMNKRLYKSIKDKVKQTKLLNRINDKRNAKKKYNQQPREEAAQVVV